MIEPAGWVGNAPQIWADLGCGKGIFTVALASLLPAGSSIYAIDRDADNLQFLPQQYQSAKIEAIRADFTSPPSLPALDGAIIANALHYVRNPDNFAVELKKLLKPQARLLIIEYDTEEANRWVPFPLSFNALEKWAGLNGFRNIRKLKERPSVYQRSNIYSAVLEAMAGKD